MESIQESAKEMLARVDERTRTILEDFKEMRNDLKNHIVFSDRRFDKTIEEQDSKIDILKRETSLKFETIKKDFDSTYVRKENFTPIQKIVYGFIGLILIAFAGAIISPVFVTKNSNTDKQSSLDTSKSIK